MVEEWGHAEVELDARGMRGTYLWFEAILFLFSYSYTKTKED